MEKESQNTLSLEDNALHRWTKARSCQKGGLGVAPDATPSGCSEPQEVKVTIMVGREER